MPETTFGQPKLVWRCQLVLKRLCILCGRGTARHAAATNKVVVKLDFRNAFNLVSREAVLRAVREPVGIGSWPHPVAQRCAAQVLHYASDVSHSAGHGAMQREHLVQHGRHCRVSCYRDHPGPSPRHRL